MRIQHQAATDFQGQFKMTFMVRTAYFSNSSCGFKKIILQSDVKLLIIG